MVSFMKRFCIILSILGMVLFFIPKTVTPVEAAEPDAYGYGLLTTEYEKMAYKAISDGLRNLDENIVFVLPAPDFQMGQEDQYLAEIKDATEKALRLVMADHPEYFWFNGEGSLFIFLNTWTTFKVTFTPYEYSVDGTKVTKSTVHSYIQKLEKAVNDALKDMPTDRDLAKIHYLHDYLAEHIDYEFSEDDQTIYGALVEGKSVCTGYSKAYQYLLSKAGIKSWYVTGYSISPSTMSLVRHAWNLVYLDGKCYYTDITWDDQDEVFHAYYMVSLDEMNESHTPDYPAELPDSCGHKDLDYFEVHQGDGTGVGMLTGSYNAAQLAACMEKVSDNTWCCHVEDLTDGEPEDFYNWLKENVGRLATALGISDGYRWSLSTLWDEYHISMSSLPSSHVHNTYGIAKEYKAPTCSTEGNLKYYICSCGSWFEDISATIEIHDKDSVKIPALDHVYNKAEKNAYQHWTVCKNCGDEAESSRADHYDNNKNGKCDSCDAAVEIPTEPTTQPTETPTLAPTTNPTQPTNPSEEPTQQPTDTPTTEPAQTETTQPSTEVSEPTDDETSPSTGVSEPSAQPTEGNIPTDSPVTAPAGNTTEQTENNEMLPAVIAGCSAAVLGAVVAVMAFKKKKD